jgi:hypothetical protein
VKRAVTSLVVASLSLRMIDGHEADIWTGDVGACSRCPVKLYDVNLREVAPWSDRLAAACCKIDRRISLGGCGRAQRKAGAVALLEGEVRDALAELASACERIGDGSTPSTSPTPGQAATTRAIAPVPQPISSRRAPPARSRSPR